MANIQVICRSLKGQIRQKGNFTMDQNFLKLSKKSLHIMKFVVLIEIHSGHAQVLSALSQASKSAKGRRLGESDHRTGFRTSLFSKKQD